jgi:hypothetical protein
MKNLLITLILPALLCVPAACGLVQDITTKDLDTALEVSMPVFLGEKSPTSIATEDIINANSNPDIRDNRKKIKSIKIEKIRLQILNYSGTPSTTISGTFSFSEVGSQSRTLLANYQNLNLSQLSASGEIIDLQANTTAYDRIAQLLDDPGQLMVYADGSITEVPTYFDLKVIFQTKVKVGI